MAFKQEINNHSIKICPSSSEKLRKKLNNQSTELRRKRRDNLFNEKRSNLIELTENEQELNFQNKQLIKNPPINQLNQIDDLTNFNTLEKFTTLINKLDNYYKDVKIIYSLFKKSPSNHINELIKQIHNTDNPNIELEFRKLFNLDSDLYDYVSYNQLNKITDTKFNTYTTLLNDTISLIKEIVNELNEFCFQQIDQQLIDQFNGLIKFLFTQNIITKQQYMNSIFKFINLIKDRKLIDNELLTYRNLFASILLIRDGLEQTEQLRIYLSSLEFWNLLIRSTEFAINLIKNQNLNDDLVQDYLYYIFNFTHYNLLEIEYGSLNDQDDLYNQNIIKLISNLKQIENLKSNLKFETLIYFIQTLNDYFDPSIELDSILSVEFINKLCNLVKLNLNSINNDLIIMIISLFANITSLESYTEMLIDFKFTLLFGNLIDKFKSFNQNTIYYILIIIKNISSINLDHFLFLFTQQTSFMDQFLNSIQFMNSDCLNETSSILEDLFNNSNDAIVQQFLKSKLTEVIPEILASGNQSLIYVIIKILNLIILNKNLKSGQLNYFIMLLESNNLIDQIEKFSFNPNSEISKLSSKLLDNYNELAEMKENYY